MVLPSPEPEVGSGGEVRVSPTDLAYVAGLLDGEGSVSISKRENRYSTTYGLQAAIYNTDLGIMNWLRGIFGGRFDMRVRRRLSMKPCYRWWLSGDKAASFLEKIEPFAKIKRRHIDAALEFWSEWSGPTYRRGARRDSETREMSEFCYQTILSLNQMKGE